MKRLFTYLFAAALSLMLVACASQKASVTFDANMKITGISNVDSEDLVELLKYKDYTAAKTAEKEAPIVHIKAKPGEDVKGLESVTVWNPNKKPTVEPPKDRKKPWEVIWDKGLQTAETLAKWGLGFKLLDNQNKLESKRLDTEAETSRANTSAWANALDREQDNPDVVFAAPLPTPTSGSVSTLSTPAPAATSSVTP